MNKLLRNLTLFAAIASALILVVYAFLLWPWSDDLYNITHIKASNVIDYTIAKAFSWDAREISPVSFLRYYMLVYLPHPISILIYLALFFASSWLLLFRIIKLKIADVYERSVFFVFFSLLLFHGMGEMTSDVVFWQAGGYYTMCLFIGLLWMDLFNKITLTSSSTTQRVLFFLLSLLTGTLTYNLTAALVVYALIMYYIHKGINFRKTISGVLLIIIVTGILLIIPGSIRRVGSFDASITEQIANFFGRMFTIPLKYTEFGLLTFGFTMFFTFVLHLCYPRNVKTDLEITTNRDLIKYLLFALTALATIAPFLVSNLSSLRTAIYFLLFGVVFVYAISLDLWQRIIPINTTHKNLANLLILLIFAIHICTFVDFSHTTLKIREQFMTRDAQLKKLSAENATYAEIEPFEFNRLPFPLFRLIEGEPEPGVYSFKNHHYELFYKIDSIRMVPDSKPYDLKWY